MKRGAPLKTYTPLARKTRLRQVSEKRAATPVKRARVAPAVSPGVRTVLLDRSGGWCEMALTGCLGTGTDPAHRLARKAGGRKGAAKAANDRPSNALWACRRCHDWSEARPAESYELGLMLREGQEPTLEPVVRRGVLVYLADDGAVLPFKAVAA
ncbi:hypothetical protein AB0B94_30445 [Micromonospora sp. NPDC048986]|uniref:hypothetical protein n=1 Tax=Micromonospora sp. NPDC048986 TaxID=3155644 RepID=UPI0033C82DD9